MQLELVIICYLTFVQFWDCSVFINILEFDWLLTVNFFECFRIGICIFGSYVKKLLFGQTETE